MKNLFDPPTAAEIKNRLEQLRPDSPTKWGKMTVGQAVAHCTIGLQMALGDFRPPRHRIGRLLGRIIKPLALGNESPMRKNSPTIEGMKMTAPRQFEAERTQLQAVLDRFVVAGRQACTSHPHPFFGPLTPDEWGVLMYKHLDHHIRQFGA